MDKQKYKHFKCNDFVLDDEFRAWLDGKTPGEDQAWESWLMANPKGRMEADKARLIVLALQFKKEAPRALDASQQWKRLESSMQHITPRPESRESTIRRMLSVFKLLAAASVLLASIFLADRYLLEGRKQKAALQAVEKKASNGQQSDVTLPDGTLVRLNAGSSLSYPKQFGSHIREVVLSGEAFFQVVPDKNAPFIIHSGKVTTKVLGTTFNIRAYPENEAVQVAVVEGRVKVSTGASPDISEKSVCLTKSEMATFIESHQALTISPFDKEEQIGWKDGVLYFKKSDFATTVKKLERWYGVKITTSETLKLDPYWRFSGSFQNKPIDYVLNVMRYPGRFSYTIRGDAVNLY